MKKILLLFILICIPLFAQNETVRMKDTTGVGNKIATPYYVATYVANYLGSVNYPYIYVRPTMVLANPVAGDIAFLGNNTWGHFIGFNGVTWTVLDSIGGGGGSGGSITQSQFDALLNGYHSVTTFGINTIGGILLSSSGSYAGMGSGNSGFIVDGSDSTIKFTNIKTPPLTSNDVQSGQVAFDGIDTMCAVGNDCNATLNILHTDKIVVSATTNHYVTLSPSGATQITPYGAGNINDYLTVTAYDGFFIIQRKPNGTPDLIVNYVRMP